MRWGLLLAGVTVVASATAVWLGYTDHAGAR